MGHIKKENPQLDWGFSTNILNNLSHTHYILVSLISLVLLITKV